MSVDINDHFSKDTLKNYLSNQGIISDIHSEFNVTQYSNGFSNLTFLLEIGDQEFVLRKPPKGAIKRGHDMWREYRVLTGLKNESNLAPKPIHFCDDHNIMGSDFYLMEKVDGIVLNLKEAKSKKVSSTDFKTISNTWLDCLVRLHAFDYKNSTLSDLGKPQGYVERQVLNWGKQYLKAKTKDVKAADIVMSWMDANKPNHYDHSLIHNDFKYDNVVFENNQWQSISAVLDWEMCTLGDPMMDLGTTLGYWTMKSDGPLIIQGIPSPTIMDGNPSRSEIVEMYAIKSGRNIEHLTFYYAYGLFKIAVIAQQIFYRYKHGFTDNPKFASLEQASELLCMVAHQAIEKNKIENLF